MPVENNSASCKSESEDKDNGVHKRLVLLYLNMHKANRVSKRVTAMARHSDITAEIR